MKTSVVVAGVMAVLGVAGVLALGPAGSGPATSKGVSVTDPAVAAPRLAPTAAQTPAPVFASAARRAEVGLAAMAPEHAGGVASAVAAAADGSRPVDHMQRRPIAPGAAAGAAPLVAGAEPLAAGAAAAASDGASAGPAGLDGWLASATDVHAAGGPRLVGGPSGFGHPAAVPASPLCERFGGGSCELSSVSAMALRAAEDDGRSVRLGADDQVVGGAIKTPIPEPGTYALMFAGLVIIGAAVRRRCNDQD